MLAILKALDSDSRVAEYSGDIRRYGVVVEVSGDVLTFGAFGSHIDAAVRGLNRKKEELIFGDPRGMNSFQRRMG